MQRKCFCWMGGSTLMLGAAQIGQGAIVAQNVFHSANWSGYFASAAAGQAFTDVSATWVIPTVQVAPAVSTYSCYWVGFDGVTDGTVEQCGIEANISGSGSASYYAWYEFAPAPEVPVSLAVHPGDTINAEVTYEAAESTPGNYAYYFDIANQTTGQSYTNTFYTSSNDACSSAEWVAEAPTLGSITTLADFGSVTFTNAMAAINGGGDQTAGTLNDTEVIMKQNGVYVAVPTTFDASGETFTINYVPEPGTICLMVWGGLPMLARRQRRQPAAES